MYNYSSLQSTYIIHSLNLFPVCSLKEFLPKEYVKSKNIEKKIKEVRYNNNHLNPEFFLAAFEHQGYRNNFVEYTNNILLFNFNTLYEFRFSDWFICTT